MEVCIVEKQAEVDSIKSSLKIVLGGSYAVGVGEMESSKAKTENFEVSLRARRVVREASHVQAILCITKT